MASQHQDTVRKPRESFEDAMARLAVEAERAGIQVRHYGNEWYATSQSDPYILHRVTLLSCDCRGFTHHGRCRHLARLLDVTGNLPGRDDQPEPEPPATMGTTIEERCVNCFGDGMVGEDDKWCSECARCQGTGRIVIYATDTITIPAA